MPSRAPLVLDANVLIDYAKAGRSVLALSVQHLGGVLVPEALLEHEVLDLSRGDCEALGIQVVTATDEQVTDAASHGRKGPLSFYDRLFVSMARDGGWICVTNDGPLRAACKQNGLEIRWGLSLMLDLVALGALNPGRAEGIARAMAEVNRYITQKVLADFCGKLKR